MNFTPRKLNLFLLFKLPSAFLTGVRTKSIDAQKCVVVVKHRWINQNPFKSMFWAVQGMAAELSTGALIMMKIQASNKIFLCWLLKIMPALAKKQKVLLPSHAIKEIWSMKPYKRRLLRVRDKH